MNSRSVLRGVRNLCLGIALFYLLLLTYGLIWPLDAGPLMSAIWQKLAAQ